MAWQVVGAGPVDILVINESVLPMEAVSDNPHTTGFMRRLATWGRVIMFDRRGVGLSDPVSASAGPTIDDWVADVVAVLGDAESAQVAVLSFGPSAGLIALLLAIRFPDRVACLSVYDAIARYRWAPDYQCGVPAALEEELAARSRAWGVSQFTDRRGRFTATAARDPAFARWATTWFRRGASPSAVSAQFAAVRPSDIRDELCRVTCPTLVINHADVDDGRYLAAHIRNSRYVELTDPCHVLFSPELDAVTAQLSELVNGSPVEPATQRVLTTLLFTNIVDSTLNAAGDRHWGDELDHHNDAVRRQMDRFEGREVSSSGDGFIAMFDSPTRAVQCALAVQHGARRRDVGVRAGVHTGEVERRGDDLLGVNVDVVQRICALASADEVLVSQQVVDLVAGSDLGFDRRGDHAVRGLAGPLVVHAAFSPLTLPRRPVPPRLEDLSPRELEVLKELASGAANAEIAATLFMSEATVKAHVSHLLVKLGCTNRVQLAILAHDANVARS